MTNEVLDFQHDEFGEIRTMYIDNEPCFMAHDIAKALAFPNSTVAILTHIPSKNKIKRVVETEHGTKQETFIGKNDVLALSCLAPSQIVGTAFSKWIITGVLPKMLKIDIRGKMEDALQDPKTFVTELVRLHFEYGDVRELLEEALDWIDRNEENDSDDDEGSEKTYTTAEVAAQIGITEDELLSRLKTLGVIRFVEN